MSSGKVTAIEVPDQLGEEFLATGLPLTCDAFFKWLEQRRSK
jgi:hypothetical protein